MEYEFTAFLEIDAEHNAFGSKDRTGIVDQQYVKITPELGRQFMKWLESGADTDTPTKVIAESKETPAAENVEILVDELTKAKADIKSLVADLTKKGVTEADIKKAIKEHHTVANYNSVKDIEIANKIIEELRKLEV
jgi:hypothetical protein